MSIAINGSRPVKISSNIENPPEKKALSGDAPKQQLIETTNPDSRLGESSFYGLMLKNSLQNKLAEKPEKISSLENQPKPALIDKSVISPSFAKLFKPLSRLDLGILPSETPTPDDGSLMMGNPSAAANNVDEPFNYLMEKSQYALSYNRDRGIPNWTSWHLDAASLGSTNRQNDFRPDETLPADWYRVTPADYSGSGYDRGHMTPSGDRTASRKDNSSTFLMTNMIPQASKNNQQTWANLENYCRELVDEGSELYIVAGGHGTKEFIADGRIAVPEFTWKVILAQPAGTEDVSRVTDATRVIAVYMPNDNNIDSDWRKYLVSTDFIEQETGYNFFSNIPVEIQNAIESKVDTE
jgi:endonuclease G